MYTSNLSMGATIPQGIDNNNTFGAFTGKYFFSTIKKMSEFDDRQLLLIKIRDTHCGGSAAELARKISKDGSYVHRLFYPIGKKGRKGIGLEIMNACTSIFTLPAGYWEGASPTETTYNQEQFPTAVIRDSEVAGQRIWPFRGVSEWQYSQLSAAQKEEVEKYVRLQLSTKDPTLEQISPAYIAKTGTH